MVRLMVWRDRHARAVLVSILLSSIGMGVYVLALGQMLFTLTGSAQAFAMILTLQGVGAVCVLPFSGPLVDALRSRQVYVVCGLARAATMLTIVLVIVASAATGAAASVPAIGAAALLLAVFDSIQRAALFKFSARHIDDALRVRVNGLLGAAIQIGALAGMALLGLILMVAAPVHALLVDVAMACAASAVMARLRLDRSDGQAAAWSPRTLRSLLPDALRDWRRMLGQYRGEAVVLGMIALCAADFVFAHSLSTLVVPLVHDAYGGRSGYIAALEATFGIGMLAASALTRYTVRQSLLPLWLSVQAGVALLLALGGDRPVHFLAFFLGGFANLNSLVWLLTSLQQHARSGDKAKMASLRMLAIGAGTIALMPWVGYAARLSLQTAFLGVAALMAAFALAGVWIALGFRPQSASALAASRP